MEFEAQKQFRKETLMQQKQVNRLFAAAAAYSTYKHGGSLNVKRPRTNTVGVSSDSPLRLKAGVSI